MTDAEFEQLVADSLAYMHQAIESCNRDWDFQSYGGYSVSLDRRVLTFDHGPRPPIDCTIEVVGVYMTNRNVWRWSWDNPSIEPQLRSELEKVRLFGQEHGIPEITLGGWDAKDEEAAWAMTAIAAKLLGAISVYRTTNGPRNVFLLVFQVGWAQADSNDKEQAGTADRPRD